jgi:FSR family fosmidomycin resistance protein-like MFS transporter
MNTIEENNKLSALESANSTSNEINREETFHTVEVVTLAAAHGAHDTYFSFLPTILPLLIQNLSLNTTQAGLLSAASQIPNLLQPLIGHLADRKDLKLLVILAPTLSGILITLVGVAPNFGAAALLLLLAGFSTAGFHSIAPAMAGARAGHKVGRGMGFFMVGGELGFGIGPLIVVATIGFLTLEGLPWLMTLGMLASVILYFRLKDTSTVRQSQIEPSLPVRQALGQMSHLILPIIAITFITGFLNANFVNYLPTFMSSEGATFALAGVSLSIVELGGSAGVLLMGLFSDRLGHRNVALIGILASIAFSLGFLFVHGWLQIIMLIGTGLCAFVANPAFLAILQTRFASNRSLTNGIYMSSSFIARSIVVVIVGVLADNFGMRPVFIGGSLFGLLSIPFIFMLPKK